MNITDSASNSDDDYIVESFFDLYRVYMELQYIIELCKPYFELPSGRKIIDDLIHISRDYSSRIELIVNNNRDALLSESTIDIVSSSITNLADKFAKIPWPEHVRIYNDTIDAEFAEYVTSALISTEPPWQFEGREWSFVSTSKYPSKRKELICKSSSTREWNGAHIVLDDDKVSKICLFENDTSTFTVHVYNDGIHEIIHSKSPVEVAAEVEVTSQPDNKNNKSDVPWGAVIAGTVGGLLLSSILKTSKTSKVALKEHGVKHEVVT